MSVTSKQRNTGAASLDHKSHGNDSTYATNPSTIIGLTMTMGWQLAIAVLVPMLLGVYIGKVTNAQTAFVLVGFVVAMIFSAVVIRRFYRIANSLPVPKMTAADKKRLQKLNEEDEDD